MPSTDGRRLDAVPEHQASWTPMLVIALAQILLIFNVSTLQVSVDGIASSFTAPATSVGTAIVTYALVVAAFIMLGGRIAEMVGARRLLRLTVVIFGGAMTLAALSPNTATMILAQVAAGAAAAALVPTLVVLIAENYDGRQRERALGMLGGASALGIVLAFLIAGSLATAVHWRATFGLLVLLAAVVYRLSTRLTDVRGHPGVRVDRVGIVLVAAAILLISTGSNSLTSWGVLLARGAAPFSILDLSPAPLMILCGVFLMQGFLTWTRSLHESGGTPLVSLQVLGSPQERAALFCLFVTSALASALTFLIPLYIQVIQGRSSFETAVAVIPFSLASVVAAVLVVRLFDYVSYSLLARYAFIAVTVGITLLAIVMRNDWGDALVIAGMTVAGVGEGALMTLLFAVLAAASPKELAGDVGSLRGAANNLATAVGTAVAGALVVGLLGATIHRDLAHNARIPNELRVQVDLDNVAFIGNDQLRERLARTTATPAQVDEAVRINTDARLVSLKVTFFALAGLALLAFFPAGALPGHVRSAGAPQATSRDAAAETARATGVPVA